MFLFLGGIYQNEMLNVLMVHLLKNHCVKKLKTHAPTKGLSASALRTAIAYIHEHLDQNIGLSELAASVHMGSHYFSSLFKQSIGQSPYQYVIACRIERAKLLLANKDLTISTVCKEVGFPCPSHFTKVFYKHTNMTPNDYRRRI